MNAIKSLNQKTQLIKEALSAASFVTCSKMTDLIEMGKKFAAIKAVDENINAETKVIGIGSGSTIIYAIERLAEKIKEEKLNVVCIPSSFQSKQALIKYGLHISDLECFTSTDVTIDGADEVDKDLNCIKGGGGCHFQEKLLAYCAKKFVIIADSRKKSQKLGEKWQNGVPIEILPSAHRLVKEEIEKLLGGEAVLRQAKAKAGPVVTDNGNFIIDWKFDSSYLTNNVRWSDINIKLKSIAGIIETGLFLNMAKVAYFGESNGGVVTLRK